MPKVYSNALDQSIEVERIIGHAQGDRPGPCLVFLAGIHGNEPSGIFALRKVFDQLSRLKSGFKGSIYAIAGNLWALERGERFQTTDLNRLWTRQHIEALESGTFVPKNEDELQQLSIQQTIDELLEHESGPFYFFDLHTTSSDTIPFITLNDSLLNRKFSSMYPVPSILGIEEYLDGPILSYINELGYISFGFEGGQHDSVQAIENHELFALLSLIFTGAVRKDQLPYERYLKQWKALVPDSQAFYEIFDRYEIGENETFVMRPGFSNFQRINKGQVLAESNGKSIVAPHTTTIFMPLYQSKGNDGFFLIKPTPRFFLRLSAVLRRLRADRLFPYLPGVRWLPPNKETMVVDSRIARFITRDLFHLFGYRSRKVDSSHLLVRNREYRSRNDEYAQEAWYQR